MGGGGGGGRAESKRKALQIILTGLFQPVKHKSCFECNKNNNEFKLILIALNNFILKKVHGVIYDLILSQYVNWSDTI